MSNKPAGLLLVVSAPSATGKTTVVEQLVQVLPGLRMSRSYTSRPARPGEEDGLDYNFISRAAFEAMIARDAFLEWADVFGNYYGTGREETESRLAAGEDLVLVIDVQGARQVREHMPQTAAVFMLPPSFEVLEQRLRKRSKDPEPEMLRRLETARREVDAVSNYDYVVVNDVLERCVGELAGIVVAERAKLARRRASIDPIIETFRG
ncbi:MAG TPA: guanylate kinase [Vicinamibacterales bacterium]|nr:guanylate kinase [Vicinamibacterales bacterium]